MKNYIGWISLAIAQYISSDIENSLRQSLLTNSQVMPKQNLLSLITKACTHILNVTGFRKTDHIVTIDIARNTDLKY